MAGGPIYKGGIPFFKPGVRFKFNVGEFSGQGAPTSGTSGTGAGKFDVGSTYNDQSQTNGISFYLNTGTKASPTWTPSGGPAVGEYARVALTSANILAMNATPVTIIAAPGSGLAIIVEAVCFEMIASSTAYASGGAVTLQYHGGSTNPHSGSVPASVVNAGAAGTTFTQLGPATAANGTTVPANVAVEITNATGAFTTGTGTAIVHIWFAVITG